MRGWRKSVCFAVSFQYIRQHQTEFISFINTLPDEQQQPQFVQVTPQEQQDIEQVTCAFLSNDLRVTDVLIKSDRLKRN